MTTPPGKKPPSNQASQGPAKKPAPASGGMPPPAKYQPTKHDAADARVYGRMKGDEADPRLRCPKDATYMEKVMVGSTEIDRCASCGAMWFDRDELEKILGAADAKAHAEIIDIGSYGRRSGISALGNVVCPRDRSPLIEVVDVKQPHIKEHACTKCGGILLDTGELRDLTEFTLGERVRGLLARLKGS